MAHKPPEANLYHENELGDKVELAPGTNADGTQVTGTVAEHEQPSPNEVFGDDKSSKSSKSSSKSDE